MSEHFVIAAYYSSASQARNVAKVLEVNGFWSLIYGLVMNQVTGEGYELIAQNQ